MNYTNRSVRKMILSVVMLFGVMLIAQAVEAQCVTPELKRQWRAGRFEQVVRPLLNCHNNRQLGVNELEYEYMVAKTLCNLARQRHNGCKAYKSLKSARGPSITVFGAEIDLDQDACCELPDYRAAASPAEGVGVSTQHVRIPFDVFVNDVRAELGNEDSTGRRAAVSVVERYAQITSKLSGRCMDVLYGSTDNAALLVQYDCHNQANQSWRLVRREDGYYNIIVRHSGKCLDVNGSSRENGVEIFQYDCHDGDNQRWQLARSEDGYSIIAKHSGKCLDVYGGNQENLAHIVQWDCHGGSNQRWVIAGVALGTDTIVGSPSGTRAIAPGVRVAPPPQRRRDP